jgi:hypothetical protein
MIVLNSWGKRTPQVLILLGEEADDQNFLDTVQEALRELSVLHLLDRKETLSYDPQYVAARVAEFAKRWQASTWNCKERVSCATIDGVGVQHQQEL